LVFSLSARLAESQDYSFLLLPDGQDFIDGKCIYKDKRGFLWIGTVNGLLRFDGYNYIRYRNIPGEDQSIC